MRLTSRMWIAAAAFTTAGLSLSASPQTASPQTCPAPGTGSASSQAGEVGWLDSVDVDMVDTAYGWVCENEDAFHTPSYGSIDVFLGGPAGIGTFYGNFPLSQGNYGYYKDGVTAAGFCGTNTYVGFRLSGWFANEDGSAPSNIYLYWHDSTGRLTKIGGSPLTMTKMGMNP